MTNTSLAQSYLKGRSAAEDPACVGGRERVVGRGSRSAGDRGTGAEGHASACGHRAAEVARRRLDPGAVRRPIPGLTREDLSQLARMSARLRKEREFAFYGDIDFIPTEQYAEADATPATEDAATSVTAAARVMEPTVR